jgi:hypothetical protein
MRETLAGFAGEDKRRCGRVGVWGQLTGLRRTAPTGRDRPDAEIGVADRACGAILIS